MLVKALEAAKDELDLLHYDDPEDYLRLDDYSVWTGLRECKKSRGIMVDLEMRRLLKCTYERTLYATEDLISNVITKQTVRDDIQKEIARKAKVPEDDVIIDVPTLPSVPYHRTVEIQPLDIPVFLRLSQGRKRKAQLAEVSRIGFVLRAFMNLVRVYTKEKYRDRVEQVSKQILGETPVSAKISV
jgi:HD superfamily phosphohydrolase